MRTEYLEWEPLKDGRLAHCRDGVSLVHLRGLLVAEQGHVQHLEVAEAPARQLPPHVDLLPALVGIGGVPHVVQLAVRPGQRRLGLDGHDRAGGRRGRGGRVVDGVLDGVVRRHLGEGKGLGEIRVVLANGGEGRAAHGVGGGRAPNITGHGLVWCGVLEPVEVEGLFRGWPEVGIGRKLWPGHGRLLHPVDARPFR